MKKHLAYVLGFSAVFLLPGFVAGQSTFTGGGDGTTWNDAANWDAGLPTGANANVGDGSTVGLSTNQTINELDLVGDQSTGTATLNHSAGTLTGGGWMKVGGAANNGTYNLNGSASNDGFAEAFIGFAGGTGAVNLSDNASLNVGSVRLAAEQPGSTGTLTVADNASLTAGNINMGGDTSTATVNQSGGTVASNAWVAIANFGTGGTAEYDISGGSVSANNGNFAIGQEGDGTLNVSGSSTVSHSFDPAGDQTNSSILVGGVSDNGFIQDGTGTLNITGSSASITGADFRVGLTEVSTGSLSWTADAGGITEIVSADNTEFGPGISTLSLDLTADANSSVMGTEYLLVDNNAAVSGTFTGLDEGAIVDLGGGNSGTISYAGGTDGFDIVVTAGAATSLAGDFDNDGDVDQDDIDFYSGNLDQPATGALAQLDLNDDDQVTIADHTLHVETLAQTSNGEVGALLGDANLDGTVDVLGDAAILVNNLGMTSGVGFATGDFNADGQVDVLGDAALLVNNLGQSNTASGSPATSAVPEPGSLSLLALSWITMNVRRKR